MNIWKYSSLLAFLLTPAGTFSLTGLGGAGTDTTLAGGSQSSSDEYLEILSTSLTARTFLCFSGGSFLSIDLDLSLFTSSSLLLTGSTFLPFSSSSLIIFLIL